MAPIPTTWWKGGGVLDQPGFLSLDDHNNLEGASKEPVTVTLDFAVGVQAGLTYELSLPIYTAAGDFNGVQYLDVSIMGAGVAQPGAVQGFVGLTQHSEPVGGLEDYPLLEEKQAPIVSISPTETGTVLFRYTFTLPYMSGGTRQNADMFVQAPQLLNCN